MSAIREDHAQALAVAEAIARKQLQAEAARANALEAEYLAARRVIANQSRTISNQRIIHASTHIDTADGTCRFGPEWVRLYNEAIGAGGGGNAVPGTAPGPAGDTRAAQAADTGILPGGRTVTPEDILAHARDYGRRNRAMEAQLTALIAWANGLHRGEVTP